MAIWPTYKTTAAAMTGIEAISESNPQLIQGAAIAAIARVAAAIRPPMRLVRVLTNMNTTMTIATTGNAKYNATVSPISPSQISHPIAVMYSA